MKPAPDPAYRSSLVFAYGSNLNPKQMEERCPSWKFFGRGALHNFRLAFAGHSPRWRGPVATIEHAPRQKTIGVIYRVNSADLRILDSYEGHPAFYQRLLAHVKLDTGAVLLVNTYQLVRDADRPGLPSEAYAKTIAHGYGVWGFKVDILARALKRTADRAIRGLQV